MRTRKSRDQRYKEAIERNIANANRRNDDKYKGDKLEDVKTALGIRKDDPEHDQAVLRIVQG